MSVIKYSDNDLEDIIQAVLERFHHGDPVVLPTETLYGIGAPISNRSALMRIFHLKERPLELTLPIAVGNLPMVDGISVVHRWQKTALRNHLPGPATFILENKGDKDPLVVRNGTVAIRVPRHPLYIPLTKRVGPLGLTSANIHGGAEFPKASEIDVQFKGDLLVIEDDKRLDGKASSIFDLTDEVPTILREGNLNIYELMGGDHGRG